MLPVVVWLALIVWLGLVIWALSVVRAAAVADAPPPAPERVPTGRVPFAGNGKAIALGEPEGLVKTIFDKTTGQLLGSGLTDSAISKRAARGVLHRVHRGVYAVVPPAASTTETRRLSVS